MLGKSILLMPSSRRCGNAKHPSRLGCDLAAQSFYLAAAPFAFQDLSFPLARATGFLSASFCSCRQTRLTGPDCTAVQQVQETAKGWDPTSDVDGATATLLGAGQAIVSGAIWFGIVWLPVILVLLVIALIARWAIRRFMPKPTPVEPVPGWGGGN